MANKVNLLVDLNDFKNAKIGAILVKDKYGVKVVNEEEFLAPYIKKIDELQNALDGFKTKVLICEEVVEKATTLSKELQEKIDILVCEKLEDVNSL